MTMLPFTSESAPTGGVDLRTLRAVRVLRPLKLVSGIPSKKKLQKKFHCIFLCKFFQGLQKSLMVLNHFFMQIFSRPSSGFEVNSLRNGPTAADRSFGAFCHRHFCNYRTGILFRRIPCNLLR